VLFPEYYAEAVRDLAPIDVDPATKVPIFREASVAIEHITPHPSLPRKGGG
jgi:hypothetical protein